MAKMEYKHGYVCEKCKKDLELELYQSDKRGKEDQVMKFIDLTVIIKGAIMAKNGSWSQETAFDGDRIILCEKCFRDVFGSILRDEEYINFSEYCKDVM